MVLGGRLRFRPEWMRTVRTPLRRESPPPLLPLDDAGGRGVVEREGTGVVELDPFCPAEEASFSVRVFGAVGVVISTTSLRARVEEIKMVKSYSLLLLILSMVGWWLLGLVRLR